MMTERPVHTHMYIIYILYIMCTSESAPQCMMYDREEVVGGGGTFHEGRAGAEGMGCTERGDNNMNHCQCQISLGGGDHRGEERACMRVCVCVFDTHKPSTVSHYAAIIHTHKYYTHI